MPEPQEQIERNGSQPRPGDWHSVVQEIRSTLPFENGKNARKADKESKTSHTLP
jgi:hypothetical protein